MKQVILPSSSREEHELLHCRLVSNPSRSELEQIASLYQEWLIHDPCSHCACFGGVQFARDTSWIAEHVRLSGSRLLVAERYDRILGFAQYFVDQRNFPPFAGDLSEKFSALGNLAYMYLILVSHELQGQGVGRDMYELSFRESRGNGCAVMLAEVFVCPVPNSSSLKFHEALGFEYSGYTTTHSRALARGSASLTYTQLIRHLD